MRTAAVEVHISYTEYRVSFLTVLCMHTTSRLRPPVVAFCSFPRLFSLPPILPSISTLPFLSLIFKKIILHVQCILIIFTTPLPTPPRFKLLSSYTPNSWFVVVVVVVSPSSPICPAHRLLDVRSSIGTWRAKQRSQPQRKPTLPPSSFRVPGWALCPPLHSVLGFVWLERVQALCGLPQTVQV